LQARYGSASAAAAATASAVASAASGGAAAGGASLSAFFFKLLLDLELDLRLSTENTTSKQALSFCDFDRFASFSSMIGSFRAGLAFAASDCTSTLTLTRLFSICFACFVFAF
jgi:hypothetical protein